MARYFPPEAQPSGHDLFTLLTNRRSIREFKTDDFPYAKVEAILSAGNHAPSGANRHSWKYVVVSDLEKKKLVRVDCEKADLKWHDDADEKIQQWLKAKHIEPVKPFLTEAPHLVVVFGDTRDPYWMESTWISIGYMMLAAVDQELGTVIYTPGEGNFLNKMLEVEDFYSPQVILPIGIPRIDPQTNPKKQTEKEYEYRLSKDNKTVVKENIPPDVLQDNKKDNGTVTNSKIKCGCGCGKNLIVINAKRKYIPGHSKFGENGLHEMLRFPPKCKCGCGKETEWDWERMTWKKYVDAHIGIRKSPVRSKVKKSKQFGLFD